jgi:hypothetical protein
VPNKVPSQSADNPKKNDGTENGEDGHYATRLLVNRSNLHLLFWR